MTWRIPVAKLPKSSLQKQFAKQLSGQASTEDTNTQLLKQMSELMGCVKKMTDSFEKQNKAVAESKTDVSNQEHYDYSNRRYNYRGRGRGFQRGAYRGGYGRGYQNDNIRTNKPVIVPLRIEIDLMTCDVEREKCRQKPTLRQNIFVPLILRRLLITFADVLCSS